MKNLAFILVTLFVFQSCGKPHGTVFKDERLAQEEEVKFCLTGDLGKDTPHQKEIAKALAREDCDRIFFLGDLVYPKGIKSADDPELNQKFLSYYQPLIDADPGVIIALILGNHDHKGEPSAWKDVANQNPAYFFPNYYYFIDYGGLCVTAIDTSFFYYTEKISEATEQSVWLTKLQPRLKDCEVNVAITHHPLKGKVAGLTDWEGASGELKAFLETFIIGKYDLHIAGHVHSLFDDGKDEGTRMLISGTGGEITGEGRPGYLILRWEPQNPKRIGYSFRYVDTEVNIVQDPLEAFREQQQEKQDPEYIIKKHRVEENVFTKIYDSIIDKINKIMN